jgi:hypothetical protein
VVSPLSEGKVKRIIYGASSGMGLSPLPYRIIDTQASATSGPNRGQKESREFYRDAMANTKRSVGIFMHHL